MKKLILLIIAVTLALSISQLTTTQRVSAQSTTSFSFTAVGDFNSVSSGSKGAAVLNKIKSLSPAFSLALGDFSYQTTASGADSWSTNVKSILGTSFPFELIVGNHDNQNISSYVAGLPHKLTNATVVPSNIDAANTGYGYEYYFDYPSPAPLARFIFIAPGDNIFAWNYAVNSAHYNWLSQTIDSARSQGIPWVVVGMHENCIEYGAKTCSTSSGTGPDIFNLLVAKKVDLILQGHDHVYNRSKQLVSGTNTCASLIPGSYNANCVVNQGPDYVKGQGSILVINGSGGVGLYDPASTTDPERNYFAAVMGLSNNPTHGPTMYTLTPTSLTADYYPAASGGTAGGTFSDHFTITASGTTPQPTATPTPTSTAPTLSPTPTKTPTPTPTRTPTPTVVATATTIPPTVTTTPGCAPLPTNTGTATSTISLSVGTYYVWSRMMATDATNNSYWLQIDNQCPVNIGDSSTISSNSWSWVNYKDGTSSNRVSFAISDGAQGSTHLVKFVGREDLVKLDRVIFTTDASCTPDSTGFGDNCLIAATATPTPTSSSFQPSAPYYAAFFYPWFKNTATDGSWSGSTWSDADTLGSHTPPTNWFSNYLPDPNPSQFSPSSELYSSNDYTIFKWQLSKLVEAKQEVAISSWWAQGHKTDTVFNTIITDFMARSDNPYPNLRWAVYYECEGNAGSTCGSTSDPSVSQLTSDLNYIKTNYANSPYMLKVGGKPVIFVYADGTDGGSSNTNCSDTTDTSMTHRWYQANSQVGNAFYIVLKVFSGYATTPCQPNEWHQYSPAVRSDSQGTHSFAISPGFWRSGDAVRLARDTASFQTAATNMANSSATWRLTTTWNEWGEGTAVEPGTEVIQANGSTAAVQNPSGAIFGNTYIDILRNTLPTLEAGTGSSNPTPTIAISTTVSPTNSPTPTPTRTPTPTLPPTNTPQPTSASTTPSPTVSLIKGDFNKDGSVDLLDFNLWRDEFTGVAISKKSDQNNDGVVDLLDFAAWLNAFQAGI